MVYRETQFIKLHAVASGNSNRVIIRGFAIILWF